MEQRLFQLIESSFLKPSRFLVAAAIGCLAMHAACNQQPATGGPCDYDTYENTKAEVVAITTSKDDPDLLSVELKFNASTLQSEPQYLEDFREVRIDSAYLKANSIRIGRVYNTTVSEIKSGTCTPLIVSFDNRFRNE